MPSISARPVAACPYLGELADGQPGWFSGLRDRHIGAALRLIHAEPSRDWTLDSLAHAAGLSRSIFAKRFNDLIGAPPIEYLVRWRVQLAARLLDQGVRIAETASSVGYKSEATFSRVFKRFAGAPPGAWREGRLKHDGG